MPGAQDKGTGGGGGGWRERGKEEVKEVAGVEKRKGGRVLKIAALPHCQDGFSVCKALPAPVPCYN